jgi:predicted metal-dependent hydrolase
METRVRYPQIDFTKCFPRWAPNLEFAMTMNAFSITPFYLEPYIIRVFAKARAQLDPVKDADLIAEVDWFCSQEGQHYRQHALFNRVFETPRYPEVEKLGKKFAADLRDFQKNRSLVFNLTYSEGFEAAGAVFYRTWFERLGKYRIGAQEEALHLYDWHFAEEFEHREVAYKLYMRIAAGNGFWKRIWYGYFYRVYGTLKMLTHSGQYIEAIRGHLLEVERSEMTAEEAAASKARERGLARYLFWGMVRGLLAVLWPFYDPSKKPPPEGLEAVLRDFDTGGRFGAAEPSASTVESLDTAAARP